MGVLERLKKELSALISVLGAQSSPANNNYLSRLQYFCSLITNNVFTSLVTLHFTTSGLLVSLSFFETEFNKVRSARYGDSSASCSSSVDNKPATTATSSKATTAANKSD